MDFIKDFTVQKQENSQVTIEGEIPFEELQKHRASAIAHISKDMKVDGFRAGHIPEKVVVERVGEMAILSEMAERTLAKVYPEALKHHNISAIGYPQIQVTKIAQDNPLGFTATIAVLPEFSLPDYKKVAADLNAQKDSDTVTDEEVETQIKDILRQKVAYERLQQKAQEKSDAPSDAQDLPTPETVHDHTHEHGEEHDHDHDHAHDHSHEGEVTDDELPELTDEYVQTLGQPGQFTSVEDFKSKIREHLQIEKTREVTAAHRAKITDAIIEQTPIALPQVLVDSELNQMFAQMNEDLSRANLKMEDYLAHIKKTEDDLKKEWAPAAQKRAKLQLVLNEIAKEEKTEPDQSQVDAQVDQLLEQYKDADPERVRVYVASVLTNEEVMKMLESA